MPFELIESDKKIVQNIKVIFPKDPEPAGGTEGIGDILGKPFPFQFPPAVTTDSKGANWEEADKIFYEPLAIFRGAQARKLTIEAEYIVTGSKVGTGSSSSISRWGGKEIANLMQAAKSYFYRTVLTVLKGDADGEGKAFGPAVTIRNLYGAVMDVNDEKGSTWRLSDISVAYSDTLVYDNEKYWPLKSKLIINCLSYTQLGGVTGVKFKLDKLGNLAKSPTPKWY